LTIHVAGGIVMSRVAGSLAAAKTATSLGWPHSRTLQPWHDEVDEDCAILFPAEPRVQVPSARCS
jgi:hypothetical protein